VNWASRVCSIFCGCARRLCSIFCDCPPRQTPTLLRYQHSVEARWQHVRPLDPPTAEVATIDALIKSPSTWENLSAAEQRLVFFLPEAMLDLELKKRLAEAERIKLPNFEVYKKKADPLEAAQPLASDDKKALLFSVLDELHRLQTDRQVDRLVRFQAACQLLVFAVVIAILVLLPPIVAWCTVNNNVADSFAKKAVDLLKDNPFWRTFEVMAFGALGAYFSRLRSFQVDPALSSYVAIKNAFKWSVLLVRLTIGMVGALILYLTLRGHLLKGDMFPNFDMAEPFKTKDLAKLLVWSFLGGFSEKLVPETLERTEGGAKSSKSESTGAAPRAHPKGHSPSPPAPS
jgi:hypothetical protein